MQKKHLIIGGLLSTTFFLSGCQPGADLQNRPDVSPLASMMPSPSPVTEVNGKPLNQVLLNANVHVPDSEIVVKLGSGVQNFRKGVERGDIMWGDLFTATQTTGGYDVLSYVNVNHGGSGTQQYLVIFHVTDKIVTHTSSVMIGDRIPVQSITVQPGTTLDQYTVMVNYLERTPDQAMVDAPTVPKTASFAVVNHLITGGMNYPQQ